MQLIRHLYPDQATMNQALAGTFARQVETALKRQELFRVAISGGSAPDGMFAALPLFQTPDWNRIRWFWVDDRCAPYGAPENNASHAMAFLEKLNLPRENFFPMPVTSDSPAESYEALLRVEFDLAGTEIPVFDLMDLGMGPDGHFASLFPDRELTLDKLVLDVPPPTTAEPSISRVTLSLPVILKSRQIRMLIPEKRKRILFEQILSEGENPHYPVAYLNRLPGDLHLYSVD